MKSSENQRLKELMRFTVCYWHTFRGRAAIRLDQDPATPLG